MYIIFLLPSFRDARVNRYRVGPVRYGFGFPVPDRDRAGLSSAFLWGHVNSTRALLQKSAGIVGRERQLRAESHRNDYSPWRAAAVKHFLELG